VTNEETIGAAEDWLWDEQLTIGYRDQLETWTQIIGEPLQQFAIATMPFLHNSRTMFIGDQARHLEMG
jgi:hypothetical protein